MSAGRIACGWAAVMASLLLLGSATACGSSSSQPAPTATAVPADVKPASQPYRDALTSASSQLSAAQAQERADVHDAARLRSDVLNEIAALHTFEQSLQRIDFPADVRTDQVSDLLHQLQQAEQQLQSAANAPSADAMQAGITVARQAEQRAHLDETLLATYVGITPPS
ncbi:MAG: hypothetical protein ABR498_01740 [Candidatus Dormibacteria bacterium]